MVALAKGTAEGGRAAAAGGEGAQSQRPGTCAYQSAPLLNLLKDWEGQGGRS